jgi:hypothetical protein
MQLAVTGYQDTFLTGDPQLSYYQKVFTKRAGYTSELLRIAFDSDIRFGGSSICTLDNDTCDIITGFYLNFSFPSSQSVPQDAGHAYIERVDLLVGGQTIVSMTGEIMAILSDVTDEQRTRENYDKILKRSVSQLSYGTSSSTNSFYVELPFFGRSYSNSFPLLALNRHTIQVRLFIREQSELENPPLPKVELLLQAMYIDQEHKNFFLGRQLDYVIKQYQLARVNLKDLNRISFKTLFENPVKEFVMVVQNDSGTDGVFDYSSHKSTTYTSYLNDQVIQWIMLLNGQKYFDLDQITMRVIQPYEHYIQTPNYKVNIFNVGQDTSDTPSGTINMSRISNQTFQINLVDSDITRKLRLYAVNYNIFRCQGGLGGTLFV